MWQGASRPGMDEPEFRWTFGGVRSRLTLVRRLALDFEVRRSVGAGRAELWIYGEERVRRWSIPVFGAGSVRRKRIAPELIPLLDQKGARGSGLPVWDRGRCVIETGSFSRFQDAIDAGELAMTLVGERVTTVVRLERTQMSVDGRPQWLLSRAAGVQSKTRAR